MKCLLLVVLMVAILAIGVAIIVAEDRYYRKHPEKQRPDPNPWP